MPLIRQALNAPPPMTRLFVVLCASRGWVGCTAEVRQVSAWVRFRILGGVSKGCGWVGCTAEVRQISVRFQVPQR